MPLQPRGAERRMPRGFAVLIGAQFLAALADNALLLVAIALLQSLGAPPWWAPLLKLAFTLSYVVLAPLLGPLADAFAKSRLMLAMTALKLAGVAAMVAGLHPLAGLCLVGLGASAYAPAKFGLVTEMVAPGRLVAANGWIEVTVVGAVLLGTAAGGALVAPAWLALTPWGLQASLAAVGLLYAMSIVLNLRVPDSGRRYARRSLHPRVLWRDFLADNARLWRDREGGLSLSATTVFWGVGAALQFIVLRWADDALAMPLHQAALLQGVVALGVVAGAAAAGRWVTLPQAPSMLRCGVPLGAMLPLLTLAGSWPPAVALLLAAGALGGLMLVPLNALLQHRGCTLLSAGRSIAVQGFNENASVLVALSVYAGLLAAGASIQVVLWLMGGGVVAGITLLLLAWHRPAAAVPPR